MFNLYIEYIHVLYRCQTKEKSDFHPTRKRVGFRRKFITFLMHLEMPIWHLKFCELLRKITLYIRKPFVKNCYGLPLMLIEVCIKEIQEDRPGPVVLQCLLDIKQGFSGISIALINNAFLMSPGNGKNNVVLQLCINLRQN
jgi:hypothetical protein